MRPSIRILRSRARGQSLHGSARLIRRSMLAMFLGASSLIAGLASTQPVPTPEALAVRLGIVNYLDEGLSPVFINQAWAGTARAQAYTSSTCCVSLPREWVPGMTMRIEWNSDSMFERGQDALTVRDAPVLPYDISYSGYVWAIFLPGGEVRVQPSASGPGAVGFLPGLPPPGEATEAELKQFIEKTQPKP